MNLKNTEPCPHCGRWANRGVTIDAVIIKDGKILLIKRGVEPFKDYWALPGGYVGWGETIEDAVNREVREELGVDVTSLKRINIYSNPNRHPKQCIDVAYLVEIAGETNAGDDVKEFQWVDLNNVPDTLAFDHKKIIRDALSTM